MKSYTGKKQLKQSVNKNNKNKEKKKVREIPADTNSSFYWKNNLHLYAPFL